MTSVQPAVDFSNYLPPGIYTLIDSGPQIAVNSSLPNAVGLYGESVGFQTQVETVLINPDTDDTTPSLTRTLSHQGIDTDLLTVTNINSGQSYTVNTDYTIALVSGTQGTDDASYALKRVIGGHIAPGDAVQVTYQYTDTTYYNAYTFYEYDDVESAYGKPFDDNGDIQSPLSLAARFAFLNGAYKIVCVAINPDDDDEWGSALAKLAYQPSVAVVVPCSGDQNLHAAVQQHVDSQSSQRYERRGIVAVDGTTVPVSSAQRVIYAQEITDERVAMVSPDTFKYYAPELSKVISLGGQYMAASLAGMTVAMSFAQPLTRKRLSGWRDVGELQPDGQKTNETANGLLVIEKNPQQLIQVRHGVTTDFTNLNTREWSVIGQQDALAYRMRDYLDAANLIGQPIYSYTLINVKATAEAALQSLLRDSLLVGYNGLKVRQLLTNPDVIEVSFGWRPAYPLNYLVVRFAISLSTGDISVGTTGNSANSTSTSTITTPSSSAANDFGGSANTLQSI
ncbi:hypothetical protein [Mycolicibacter kumamotonensis]|uniref:hypothetical protein n=1 Tax=Mycolicibacter kumamotonensis TaxID=354243 RepID=UPI00196A1A8E|nr:hypothetical protein [Mycolicibacter kumamotonensis]